MKQESDVIGEHLIPIEAAEGGQSGDDGQMVLYYGKAKISGLKNLDEVIKSTEDAPLIESQIADIAL